MIKKLLFLTLFFCGMLSFSQNAVDSWTISSSTASSQDSYSAGGNTYQYGQGNNENITSVTYNGNTFVLQLSGGQTYKIRRVDLTPNNNGINVVGDKASIFFERTGSSNFVYEAELPGTPGDIDLEAILREATVNRGVLDVFRNNGTNGGDEGPSNIERIDVIYPALTINNALDIDLNGFIASEKNGNNTYKAAAILSLDSNGDPASYGDLVTITANTAYGEPSDNSFNPSRPYAFIEDTNNDNLPRRVGGNSERMGISLITFGDLGISAGQTFYGVSFFGDDVTNATNLVDPSTFPSNTTTGADIHGSLGYFVTASGYNPFSTDTDGDGIVDTEDDDDDNDGILDIDEFDCPSGFVDNGGSFNNKDNPGIVSGLYPLNGASLEFRYELVGGAKWSAGVRTRTGGGISGTYINMQPKDTDIPDGDFALYTFTFSETVYNVNFKWGGMDVGDRIDVTTSNQGESVPAVLTDINLGSNFTLLSSQSIVSNAGGSNAPNNSLSISVNGPVDQIVIVAGKNGNSSGNSTMQFYELSYCTAKNSDSDGIPDHLDTDSDEDGCPDAVEAAGSFTPSDLDGDNSLGNTSDGNGIPQVNGSPAQQSTTSAVTDDTQNSACSADLSLVKTVDKGVLKVGATTIFTLRLKNDGPLTATGVQVRDLLPAGLTYNAGSSTIPANTTYNSGTGIWDLGGLTITSGQTITLQIAATVSTTGVKLNTAEIISSDQQDTDSTTNNGN